MIIAIIFAIVFLLINIYVIGISYNANGGKNIIGNYSNNDEIERQLKRQTDLLERERWDRISNYNGKHKIQ